MNFHLTLILCFGLMSVAGLSHASSDPTQPPAVWGVGSSDAPAAEEGNALRLQSVMLPQRGRGVAVIGGVTVSLGGRLGEARHARFAQAINGS